jgi:excinuclease ABC subunit A
MYHTLYNFLHEKQKYIQSHIRLQLLKDGLSRKEIIQAPIMKRKKYDDLEKLAIQDYYDHISVERITGHEEVDNTLYVDQSSIGKTPRSCPATFIGVFDDIRKLYAGTTEAKMLAFKTGHFSFNSSKGACPECKGYGDKKIELQFLPDTYVPCTLCKGRRYKPEILDIKRHSKNVSEILDMYVMDALEFFEDMTFIADKLQLMVEIGLGYLKM